MTARRPRRLSKAPQHTDYPYLSALALGEQAVHQTAELFALQAQLQRTNLDIANLTLARMAPPPPTMPPRTDDFPVLDRRVEERLRAMAAQLTLAEQRERERLAEVLHGDLQQLLVGLRFALSPLAQSADGTVRAAHQKANDLLQQALQCSRSLTRELAPPLAQEDALVPALEWLRRWMQERHGLRMEVAVAGLPLPVPEALRILLFRAVRELILNVVKHAQAEKAALRIRREGDWIRIVVEDDGLGFDPAAVRSSGEGSGLGLYSIRERLILLGGSMEVASAPGKGTRITLLAPLDEPTAAPEAVAAGVLASQLELALTA